MCLLRVFQEYNIFAIDMFNFTHLAFAALILSKTGELVRTFYCRFEYIIRNFNRHNTPPQKASCNLTEINNDNKNKKLINPTNGGIL